MDQEINKFIQKRISIFYNKILLFILIKLKNMEYKLIICFLLNSK